MCTVGYELKGREYTPDSTAGETNLSNVIVNIIISQSLNKPVTDNLTRKLKEMHYSVPTLLTASKCCPNCIGSLTNIFCGKLLSS